MDYLQGFKNSRVSHLILAIIFLTSGILLNLVQGALYYCLRPINKELFRKVNYYVNYSLFSQMVGVAQFWADVKLTVHVKKSDYEQYYGKEHAFLIMNHTYEIDWLVGWMLCDYVGILGNVKTYAKKSVQYIPTLGWAWKFGGSIFLERNWEKDKNKIGKQLDDLVTYEDPVWLLLAAEGTRFSLEKHKISKVFAQERGMPVLKHHLIPRTRGFTSSLPHLRTSFNAIYNVILGIQPGGVKPTMQNILMGRSLEANMYLERIPLTEVPEDETKAAEWLHELFRKKDQMMESYFETGSWFKSSGVKEFEGFVLPKSRHAFWNTFIWGLIVLSTLTYYLFRLLLSGSTANVVVVCAVIACFSILQHKLIGQTKISKGSSYGTASPKKS